VFHQGKQGLITNLQSLREHLVIAEGLAHPLDGAHGGVLALLVRIRPKAEQEAHQVNGAISDDIVEGSEFFQGLQGGASLQKDLYPLERLESKSRGRRVGGGARGKDGLRERILAIHGRGVEDHVQIVLAGSIGLDVPHNEAQDPGGGVCGCVQKGRGFLLCKGDIHDRELGVGHLAKCVLHHQRRHKEGGVRVCVGEKRAQLLERKACGPVRQPLELGEMLDPLRVGHFQLGRGEHHFAFWRLGSLRFYYQRFSRN